MGTGIFGQPLGGGMRNGVMTPGQLTLGGGVQNGVMTPGANYQQGQMGWLGGYGNQLPMSSGDHMPLVSSPASRPPPRQAMAPGLSASRLQQPPPQQNPGGGGGPHAFEPWNLPGTVQPTPTYNDPAWGSNAIGWRGNGNAPPMPQSDPIQGGVVGAPIAPAPAVAAGSGGPSSVGAGMPAGQWQAIIQALSGLGSNMFQTPQMGAGGYTDPNFLNMLMTGLGGYR